MNKTKYHIFAILFVLYIVLIFYGCLHNFSDTELNLGKSFLGVPLDKYVHFLMFFLYPFVSWFFLRFNNKLNNKPGTENQRSLHYAGAQRDWKGFKINRDYYFAVIILTGILLGALTEGAQSWFTTYREGDGQDLGADILGVLAGSAAVFSFKDTLTRLGIKILRKESI